MHRIAGSVKIVSAKVIEAELKSRALQKGFYIEDHPLIRYSYNQNLEDCFKKGKDMPFVFTSVHGLKAVVDYAAVNKINLTDREAYSIEGNTSKSVLDSGFFLKSTARTGTELAKKIIEMGETKIMHFTANIRRKELETNLVDNGVTYCECKAYHKEKYPVKFDHFDGILFFSPSQIDIFFDLNTMESHLPAFCIGKTTAAHLAAFKHKNIIVAEQASVKSVLSEVYKYFNESVKQPKG